MVLLNLETIALIISVCSITYTYYQALKNNRIDDIKSQLIEMRKLGNWNDRCEARIFEYMNHIQESQLHRCSLIELNKIEKGLFELDGKVLDALVDEM